MVQFGDMGCGFELVMGPTMAPVMSNGHAMSRKSYLRQKHDRVDKTMVKKGFLNMYL